MARSRIDYYAVLGVPRSASAAEIRRAYKQKALEHHPDKNPDRIGDATETFKRLAEAYSVLRDDRLRALYDRDHTGVAAAAYTPREAWTFTTSRAMDVFKDVFGEEAVAGLARVAEEVGPKLQAAAAPLASALATAVESCSRAEVVKDAVAAGLGSVAADADEVVDSWLRSQDRWKVRLDECNAGLQQHEVVRRAAEGDAHARLDQAEHRAWLWTGLIPLTFALAPPVYWWLLEIWATWCIALLAVASALGTVRIAQLWQAVIRERQAFTEVERRLRFKTDRLRVQVLEAERHLAEASDGLRRAREAASRAREDLRSAERDGVSLGAAARVGLHWCGKLARIAGGGPGPALPPPPPAAPRTPRRGPE